MSQSTAISPIVLELLASRICHDLVSPVGAINNGIEFLEDMGAESLDDAMDLIRHSASQASARLQMFRLAYGAGGKDPGIKPEDVQKAVGNLLRGEGKTKQAWDPYGDLGAASSKPAFCKMLSASIMLALEVLPKGGFVSVDRGADGRTVVSATGENAVVRDGVVDALNKSVDEEGLDARLVHPYAIACLASYYGYKISIEDHGSGRVDIYID